MLYHWGLWLGRLHHEGAKVPFGKISYLILLLDGLRSLDGKYCSPHCIHNRNTCEISRDNKGLYHTIITPPSFIVGLLHNLKPRNLFASPHERPEDTEKLNQEAFKSLMENQFENNIDINSQNLDILIRSK